MDQMEVQQQLAGKIVALGEHLEDHLGGGSINIFAKEIIANKSVNANGGIAVASNCYGGAGGTGSITLTQVAPELICKDKNIILSIGETYKLSEFKLGEQTIKQDNLMSLGNLKYEILDETVAKVNENGQITGLKEGSTKIRITDIANDIFTYVFLDVVNETKVDLQEGNNFTVALRRDGTVWSYGLNDKGQLGLGNKDNKNTPTQIKNLQNIKQISTGYSHSLILSKTGELYSWGAGGEGQLGNGDIVDSEIPIKVEGLKDIKKVEAYKNSSFALDKSGIVYAWGEGYSTLPMKIIFSEKVIDISGNILLTESGKVYNISNLQTPIEGLKNIAKISAGTSHNLALSVHGVTYSWGTNTYGECGIVTTGDLGVQEIAYTIYEISAGNQISIVKAENKDIYTFGNNAQGQIGLGTTAKATGLTKINLSEDVEIEDISARRRNT